MRAVLMTAGGRPEVLKVAGASEPEVESRHDIRLQLRAAGINPADSADETGACDEQSLSAARHTSTSAEMRVGPPK